MKPVTTGIIVAAAVIVAFVAGMRFAERRDGPAKAFGKAVEEMSEAAKSN